jgi:linoleoyl-CoA desaturase
MPDVSHPVAEGNKTAHSWAVLQLKTTANFATKSKFITWFVGGLNFQIEHHLFPNISHIHYPKIAEIVKKTAEEMKLPYYEYRTFWQATKAHFQYLHELATNKNTISMA